MKIANNLFFWFLLPGVLAYGVYSDNPQLFTVGATFMWAAMLIHVPLSLLGLCLLTIKPGDPKFTSNRDTILKGKSGPVRKAISWIALIVTVALAAYAGLPVTAVLYLLTYLFLKAVYRILFDHFSQEIPQ